MPEIKNVTENNNHKPVLLKEVVEYLHPKPGQKFIDCTVGDAGHLIPILYSVDPGGTILGIDLDATTLEKVAKRINDPRAILVEGNFKNIETIAKDHGFEAVSGILFDLGYSSLQMDDASRGMSFTADSLDMRLGNQALRADEIVNTWSLKQLTEIFKTYGEERLAGSIAKKIIEHRQEKKITSAKTLAEIITKLYKKHYTGSWKIHPATKVFQALRITVNDEIENLKKALPQAVNLLEPGGKIAVISFHSLEDRIVKNFFKQEAQSCVCPKDFPECRCEHKASLKIITKKPVVATEAEVERNPRSRSAKLRVAEKI